MEWGGTLQQKLKTIERKNDKNNFNRWKKAEVDENCQKGKKKERIERRKEKAVKEEKLS